MKTFDYLKLAARHSIVILTLTSLATLAGFSYFQLKNQEKYSTTLFITVGIKNEPSGNQEENNYYNVQAADQFTETIQGWFKNPAFLNKINQQSNVSSAISAAKQEKQNLVITYETASREIATVKQNAIIKTLNSEINAYNLATSSQVQVAVNSAQSNPQSSSRFPYIAIAFILGLVSSFALSFIIEKIRGVVSSASQVKKLFKNQILDEFSNEKDLQKNSVILKKKASVFFTNNKEKLQILLLNTKYNNLSSQLKKIIDSKKYETINFPEESEKLNTTAPTIIFCQLGKSKLKDLQRAKDLLSPERGVVILN